MLVVWIGGLDLDLDLDLDGSLLNHKTTNAREAELVFFFMLHTNTWTFYGRFRPFVAFTCTLWLNGTICSNSFGTAAFVAQVKQRLMEAPSEVTQESGPHAGEKKTPKEF